jgi:hypothetical protein
MVTEPANPEVFTTQRAGPSWLRLLRAVRLAFDLRKLVLAALGLILLQAGWYVLDRLFPGSPTLTSGLLDSAPGPKAVTGVSLDRTAWEPVRSAGWRLTEPARMFATPLISLFGLGKGAGWSLHALLAVLWVVAVWGLVGGAIARTALVEISRMQGLGTLGAVRFALRFALPLIATPLCPLLGIALCALICAGFGLLYWLPARIGTVLGGILLFIPLSLGLVMALLLTGLVAGWPLMHASVAAEAEDMLDALSRSFSYLNQRLGRFAGYVVIAWLIGIPGLLAVDLLVLGVTHLAAWGLGLSAPASSLAGLADPLPGDAAISQTVAAFPRFWRAALGLLARGWSYAYFWTAASFIYLLLRHDVDGTSWTEVNHAAGRERPPDQGEGRDIGS